MSPAARQRLAIGLWLALLLVASWLAMFRTPMVTEITRLLPDAGPARERLQLLQETPAARLILIGLEGDDPAARAEVSRRLAARLRQSGRFVRVGNGEQMPTAADVRRLFDSRYLLSPAVVEGHFDAPRLRQALKARLADLRSPAAPLHKELLASDPTGEMLAIVAGWQQRQRPPPLADGVWVSTDRQRALLVAETPVAGFDPRTQAPLIDFIQSSFTAVRGDADVRLVLSGPGALATLSERMIRADAALLGSLSLAAIIAILAIAYRSLRVVLLSPLPLISAVAVGTAAVGVVHGGIHGITLGFGATLLGVSVDYPVHLFSHRRAGEPAAATIDRIWPTLRLCVLTTAIGYGAMLGASFTGLAQLALFSIAGLVTAALVTRYVLPALLPVDWAPATGFSGGGRDRRLAGIGRFALPALAVAAAAVLIVAPPRWQTDLAAINPIPADILAVDARLRGDLGAAEAGQMIFIDAADREQALLLSEQVAERLAPLVHAGSLTGFDAPSSYLPSAATQEARQRLLPEKEALQRALADAVVGLPFRAETFAPFADAVAQARRAAPVTLAELLATPIGTKLNGLLLPRPEGWTAIVLLSGVNDPRAVAGAVQPLFDQGVAFVDFRAEANRTMAAFRETSLVRLAAGGLLIGFGLLLALGDARRVLVVLGPMAVAVAVDLAVLSLEGERLTPFHLVSLLLVVGIGIDYGLFFSSPETDRGEGKRTLHALLVCSSSTAAGFSVLCFSSLPALNAIGQTVTVGVVGAFLLAIVVARPAASRAPGRSPRPTGA